ncbi:MAG TPA: hypothetical protein VG672_05605, partial [Bryobacteraceae bacterium]|nr:hypothetical protein [Bryobacteraceae bacterium]
MATSSDRATGQDPVPPSNKLRWLLFGVCGVLLILLLVSGALAARFLRQMHTQELAVTRALAERTQTLSGLWLSIQSYNQAVQQFVAQTKADRDQAARRHLDQLTLEIDSILKHYPGDRDSEEAALLDEMQGVFLRQRTLYVSILSAPPEQRKRQVENLRVEQVGPIEKQILDWSGRMQTWNTDRLRYADQALA